MAKAAALENEQVPVVPDNAPQVRQDGPVGFAQKFIASGSTLDRMGVLRAAPGYQEEEGPQVRVRPYNNKDWRRRLAKLKKDYGDQRKGGELSPDVSDALTPKLIADVLYTEIIGIPSGAPPGSTELVVELEICQLVPGYKRKTRWVKKMVSFPVDPATGFFIDSVETRANLCAGYRTWNDGIYQLCYELEAADQVVEEEVAGNSQST